jgi:hypothetical protein
MSQIELLNEPDYILPLTADRIKAGYPDIRSAKEIAKTLRVLSLRKRPKLRDKTLSRVERKFKKVEETIDDVLYWDEHSNMIYVEAIAIFKSTKEFVQFRRNLPTELHIKEYECPICKSTDWSPKNLDVKTVKDKKGQPWKCFSIIFACNDCMKEGRLTERVITIQGIKYALIKVGRGLKHFLLRIKRIGISANLASQTGSAIIEVGEEKIELRNCPLL